MKPANLRSKFCGRSWTCGKPKSQTGHCLARIERYVNSCGIAAMIAPFDVFKSEKNGDVRWIGAVQDITSAEEKVRAEGISARHLHNHESNHRTSAKSWG